MYCLPQMFWHSTLACLDGERNHAAVASCVIKWDFQFFYCVKADGHPNCNRDMSWSLIWSRLHRKDIVGICTLNRTRNTYDTFWQNWPAHIWTRIISNVFHWPQKCILLCCQGSRVRRNHRPGGVGQQWGLLHRPVGPSQGSRWQGLFVL